MFTSDLRTATHSVGKKFLKVQFGSSFIKGDSYPYLCITGEYWENRPNSGSARWENPDECGMINERITSMTGDTYKDIQSLHLSNAITGEPMYALENGWYFISKSKMESAAQLLRVPLERLEEVSSKDDLKELIETELKAHWQNELDALVEKFSIITEK